MSLGDTTSPTLPSTRRSLPDAPPESLMLRAGWAAAILTGVLLLVLHVAFLLTHGPTSTNEHRELLGWTYLEFARAGVLTYLSLLLALVAVRRTFRPVSRSSATFLGVAIFSAVLLLLGQFLHNWIVDPHEKFDSIWISLGWTARLLGLLLMTIAMLGYGVTTALDRRYPSAWRVIPALNALTLLLPFTLEMTFFPGRQEDTLAWVAAKTLAVVPYVLTWIWTGLILRTALQKTRNRAAEPRVS